MAPLGITLVNLLIESSSLSCFSEGRQAKKGEEFAQNSPLLSPSPTNESTTISANLAGAGCSGGEKGTFSASSSASSSSSSPPPSPSPNYDGANFVNNNNNYFSGASQNKKSSFSSEANNFQKGEAQSSASSSSPTSSQKLYSFFWEKFKSPCDLDEEPASHAFPAAEKVTQSEETFSKAKFESKAESGKAVDSSTKFFQSLQRINSKLVPLWALLAYPSDLHFYGRAAVMTVVTGYVIEKTLEDLPDIAELQKKFGPMLHCHVLDGSDPNQPGRVGVDKHFF